MSPDRLHSRFSITLISPVCNVPCTFLPQLVCHYIFLCAYRICTRHKASMNMYSLAIRLKGVLTRWPAVLKAPSVPNIALIYSLTTFIRYTTVCKKHTLSRKAVSRIRLLFNPWNVRFLAAMLTRATDTHQTAVEAGTHWTTLTAQAPCGVSTSMERNPLKISMRGVSWQIYGNL